MHAGNACMTDDMTDGMSVALEMGAAVLPLCSSSLYSSLSKLWAPSS